MLPVRRRFAMMGLMWAAVAGLGIGCGSSGGGCDLDGLVRQRAGAGAVNCGRVAVGASTTAVDQCIADQSAQGHAFYAHYDVQGIDSRASLGAASDAGGHASLFIWDSDPSGGGNGGARITETACSGDPPLQTRLDQPSAVTPVFCNVAGEVSLACGI